MFEHKVVVGLIDVYELKFVYFCVALDFFSIITAIDFFHLVRGVPKNMEAFMIVL